MTCEATVKLHYEGIVKIDPDDALLDERLGTREIEV
jgi:hypothetical protein